MQDRPRELDLVRASVDIIRRNQSGSGAYVASPAFRNYAYCWLRDGTFTAYAMDLAGEHASARAFHEWVDRVIVANLPRLEGAVQARRCGDPVDPADTMPARYNLDGTLDSTDWPNFQLDGYGTWLWGLAHHSRRQGLGAFSTSVLATCRYIAAFWDAPNYDCWEENGDRVHTSTLAALFGGVSAVADMLDVPAVRPGLRELAEEIKAYILTKLVRDGRLVKNSGSDEPDASVLWAIVPFGVVAVDDPVAVATVSEIERALARGGVKRYPSDTYYGGGEWIILTAWLGWYHALAGNSARARQLLSWIEAQANERGELPEQVPSNLNSPEWYEPWVRRWGPIATPLLWSHAMYLVLVDALARPTPETPRPEHL